MARESLYEPSFEHDACGFGFVCDIRGRASASIVRDALQVLVNLEHRGATGAEPDTGDGAGLLVQVPHAFLAREARTARDRPPGRGRLRRRHGLPAPRRIEAAKSSSGSPRARSGRPASPSSAGATSRPTTAPSGPLPGPASPSSARSSSRPAADAPTSGSPAGDTVAAARGPADPVDADGLAFERRLFVGRRLAEKAIARSSIRSRGDVYLPSLSARTIVYKGMLNASQLGTSIPTSATPPSSARSRWSTRASPRTPSLRGRGRTRTATSATTARSTRCAAT